MKIYYTLRLVLYTVLAVLIGVYSHQLLDYLHYLVGGVMVLFGIEGIFIPVAKDIKTFIHKPQFFLGHVNLVIGIVMMAAIRDFNNICMIWATWTIVREAFEIYEEVHKLIHRFPAVLSFILSIVEVVFSILLLIYASEHHALTHIYLLIPELIINGLSPLLFEIHLKRRWVG